MKCDSNFLLLGSNHTLFWKAISCGAVCLLLQCGFFQSGSHHEVLTFIEEPLNSAKNFMCCFSFSNISTKKLTFCHLFPVSSFDQLKFHSLPGHAYFKYDDSIPLTNSERRCLGTSGWSRRSLGTSWWLR